MTKILYVFDSVFHTNIKIAKQAEQILNLLGVEYKIKRVERVSGEISELLPKVNHEGRDYYEIVSASDMAWADGYVIASPIHSGMISASMKYFLDRYHEEAVSGAYLNKPFTAVVTGGLPHAGAEKALEQLYSVAMQWGCLVVSTSLTEVTNNPYGISLIVDEETPYDPKLIDAIFNKHLSRFCTVSKLVSLAEISSKEESKNSEKQAYKITDVFRY